MFDLFMDVCFILQKTTKLKKTTNLSTVRLELTPTTCRTRFWTNWAHHNLITCLHHILYIILSLTKKMYIYLQKSKTFDFGAGRGPAEPMSSSAPVNTALLNSATGRRSFYINMVCTLVILLNFYFRKKWTVTTSTTQHTYI
jgi:hypothetical protein